MDAKVFRCKCNNEGQDRLHGKGMRVFTPMKKVEKQPPQYRCTVCLAVKTDTEARNDQGT